MGMEEIVEECLIINRCGRGLEVPSLLPFLLDKKSRIGFAECRAFRRKSKGERIKADIKGLPHLAGG